MAQQEDRLVLSKKGKREVSSFIGHELLYDYLSKNLDEERQKAVAEHIKFSRDAQLDLGKIQNGQAYVEELAETLVSQPIIDQISAPSSYLNVLMEKSNFDRWPQGIKWGLEALVVVGVIVSLLTVAPWEKVLTAGINSGSKEVILAEVEKTSKPQVPIESEHPAFIDEDIKTAQNEVPPPPSVQEKAPPPTKPSPSPIATTSPTKSADSVVAATAPAVSGGFLYRGTLEVTNLEVIGPKITDKILEMGGRKAGDVELGWKKTPDSMYFHFTIPEAKYQELNAVLAGYGTPKIQKEKHSRVMPDGIIRLIITVDEASQ